MAVQKSISFVVLLLLLRSPFLYDKIISFDYIFQFGDSINDTGNFHWDDHNLACRQFPYGISLPPGTLIRCSDGLIMIDYFAKFFNLTLNPYLEEGADFSHGVNFAVAGSTALDTCILEEKHIFPSTNISLPSQVKWFKSHLNSMCNEALDCKQKLQKALFFMGEIGGNDYNYALFVQKPTEELYGLVPDVIQAIKNATKELINLGAITMVLPGNFPIGCLPIYLTTYETHDLTMYDDFKCLKGLNNFAKFHNDHLQEAINELRQEYSHVNIVYADYYSALRWVIKNAPLLGFDKDEIQKTCCGSGDNSYNYNPRQLCGKEGVPTCVDPNKRISWDGMHFTQHTYQQMAQWLLQQILPNILVTNNIQVI